MRTIHKQSLNIADEQIVIVPQGSEFISVANQGGKLCLWFMCDPQQDKINRIIKIVGTGHLFPEAEFGRFIGTVLTNNDALVWHVFEGA